MQPCCGATWKKRSANTSSGVVVDGAAEDAISAQAQRTAIPRRFSAVTRQIWLLQTRFAKTRGKRWKRLLYEDRFRAGYDFLLLREDAGETEPGLGEWWTRYQDADEHMRLEMTSKLDQPRPRKRRRRSRKPTTPPQDSQ